MFTKVLNWRWQNRPGWGPQRSIFLISLYLPEVNLQSGFFQTRLAGIRRSSYSQKANKSHCLSLASPLPDLWSLCNHLLQGYMKKREGIRMWKNIYIYININHFSGVSMALVLPLSYSIIQEYWEVSFFGGGFFIINYLNCII